MKQAAAAKTKQVVEAHAADAAGHATSIWHNADLWLAVSFVIFIGIFVKFVLPMILKGLDARAATIREQLEQASRLRAEAQELLLSYQRQQEEMLKEAEALVATAQRDAAAIRERAEIDLKQALDRRTQQAQEKIARAESEAVSHIRTRMVTLATDSAREMLAEQAKGTADNDAIARAISAIETQIH